MGNNDRIQAISNQTKTSSKTQEKKNQRKTILIHNDSNVISPFLLVFFLLIFMPKAQFPLYVSILVNHDLVDKKQFFFMMHFHIPSNHTSF